MEVEEEDSGSSQDNFCFLDNSTNPETIRQDPAPSTSRITVPMSSRNFRINKTKEGKLKLCSSFKRRRRNAIGGIRRGATATGLPATSSALGEEADSHPLDIEECPLPTVQAASATAGNWRARAMTTIDEETAVPPRGHTGPHPDSAPASATKLRMAKYAVMYEESTSGNSRHLDRILAALRVNVQRMKAMSRDNPDALRDTLPDETIAMMRKFHI